MILKNRSKLNIGLKGNSNAGGSASVNSQTTETTTKTFVVKRKQKSDPLAKFKIYFYDPLILSQKTYKYDLKEYSTGHVTFGIKIDK